MAAASYRRPLPAKALRWRCAPSRFRFERTAEAEPLVETIGQEEALEALRLGVELYGPGYNVYVAGLPGLGKTSVVTGLLVELTPRCALPPDRVYVHNFRDPLRPRLLELPRGDGRRLTEEMARAVEFVAERVRRLAEDESFVRRRAEVLEHWRAAERQVTDDFESHCRAGGFAPAVSAAGAASEPDLLAVVGDRRVAVSDLEGAAQEGAIPPASVPDLQRRYVELRGEMASALRRARAAAVEGQRAIEAIEREAATAIVGELEKDLRSKFSSRAVAAWLREAREHFVARFPFYARAILEAGEGLTGPAGEGVRALAEDVLREFTVNLVADSVATKGCPVVIEQRPTWTNLFGQIDRDIDPRGNARTDFRLVRGGSVLRADGGYLVLQVRDVLAEEGVWSELKRVLRSRQLEIRIPDAMLASVATVLRPDPIPLNVKVILIGDEETWVALREGDPEFAETFKVRVAFERDTPLSDGALRRHASFFHKLATDEGLPHLDRTGLAAVAEEAVRAAGRQGRLSVRFGPLSDLVREAAYVALRRAAERIRGVDVAEALRAARRRLGLEERRVHEAIREGLILLQTSGARVGQVNGLAVYDFGDHRFGKVARITAAVGAGPQGVLNVERLADLSGSAHDKGVLILSGYLRAVLGSSQPLSFTASLVFEQSYGGIDGDSATCAEVFAVLSALAGVPVRQDLAVTGSMNQLGDVQAVGGVNDKVEGFFDLCASRGLTGTQGVVIPRANVKDLMLRPEVVAACAAGRFAVYAIDRVEQGLELLSGKPSGYLGPGRFRAGSVYALAFARASRFGAHAARAAHGNGADAGTAASSPHAVRAARARPAGAPGVKGERPPARGPRGDGGSPPRARGPRGR